MPVKTDEYKERLEKYLPRGMETIMRGAAPTTVPEGIDPEESYSLLGPASGYSSFVTPERRRFLNNLIMKELMMKGYEPEYVPDPRHDVRFPPVEGESIEESPVYGKFRPGYGGIRRPTDPSRTLTEEERDEISRKMRIGKYYEMRK